MLQRLRGGGWCHGKNLAAIARCVALGLIYSEEDAARDQAHLARAAAACGVVFELEPDDVQEIFLWPENVECWNLFHQEFSTQWLRDVDGPYSLNYPGIESGMRLMDIKRKRWAKLFAGFQEMERAMLAGWAEQRSKET